MKLSLLRLSVATGLLILMNLSACKDSYLEQGPLGNTSEETLATKAGVDGLLIGAYSMLDGIGGPGGTSFDIAMGVSNWVFGSVASDEAFKGSELGDQPDQAAIENYTSIPTSFYFNDRWRSLYAGVQRANDVLRVLAKVPAGALTANEAKQIKAEAIFLRSVFHLEATKMWRNVPYVDETISFASGNYNVSNTAPIYPRLEADFKLAADNLTATSPNPGRANLWAAKSFLAKVYMFQGKYAEAKLLLADVIANGVTTGGKKYALVNFADNFNPSRKNSAESVFAVQMSVNDGSVGQNGNYGDRLAMPNGGPSGCCNFFQPSFSLVNSFKTNPATGLPLFDTFNDADVTNDQGLKSSDPFNPYEGTLDPRLDYTVGRRGIPYLDWGIMPGASWLRSQASGGPFLQIKNIYYQAQKSTTSELIGGWATATNNNYNMIRFADIILWAAECEVEIGSLAQAEAYVNQIRRRAADPTGWVYAYVDNSDPLKGVTSKPAANYKIGLYTGQFVTQGKAYAREAVRFERKLELALEGHRFFDLQRYDNGTGYMANVLNAHLRHDANVANFNATYLKGALFTKGKNELFPIPQAQIDLSVRDGASLLKQNPNY